MQYVLVTDRLQGKMMGPPGADMLWATGSRRGPRTFGRAGIYSGNPVPDELRRADGRVAVLQTLQVLHIRSTYLHLKISREAHKGMWMAL